MQRQEIDGVRVLWRELPGEVAGTLAFGVGVRDEDIDRLGITDLVARHLSLNMTAEVDVSSGLLETSFTVSGEVAEVAAGLGELAALVTKAHLHDMGRPAGQAHPADRAVDLDLMDDPVRDPWGSLMARRLGPCGPGLLRWPAVDPRLLTADEVRAHLARFFNAGNAVVTLTAAPPDGLRLALPAGTSTATASPVVPHSGPSWYADEVTAPGIALTATSAPAAFLVLRLLGSRVDGLLERSGVIRWSTEWSTPVGGDRLELGLTVQQRREGTKDSAVVAQTLWQELRRLATEEPSPAELSDIVTRYERPLDEDPRLRRDMERVGVLASYERARMTASLDDAGHRALNEVYDEFSLAQVAEAARLTPADVRFAVASWLPSALLVVPVGVSVELDGMTRIGCPVNSYAPPGEVLRPSLARRLRGAKGELVLTGDGFHLVDADGAVHTFPMADVMLVQREDQSLLGNIRHGCLVDISGFAGVDRLAARLPARRHRRAPG